MDKKQQSVSTSTATDTVINKSHLQLNNQQAQCQLETASSGQDNVDHFSQPVHLSPPSPKITVSLPEHAASKLRDLVQRRDIALMRLGIISVQFDNDQIIPLTISTTATNTANQSITTTTLTNTHPIETQPVTSTVTPATEIHSKSCKTNCVQNIDAAITAFTNLPSPGDSILEDNEALKSNLDNSNCQILDSSIAITATTTTPAMSHAPISITTATQQTDCNNISVVYADDDDGKDEDEVANEVENQHSGYSIQLSQLGFADTIDLEMYDNDNLLFPDYTLNLS